MPRAVQLLPHALHGRYLQPRRPPAPMIRHPQPIERVHRVSPIGPHHAPPARRHPDAFWGMIVAAGIRPCSGAILLLLFSMSQGAFLLGVTGVVAMSLGSAITVVLIGLGVVGVRRSLVALAAGGGSRTARLLDRGLGFLAPGMIMVFGLLMAWATWIRISAGI